LRAVDPASTTVTADVDGVVVDVLVRPGATVRKGQDLVIVESMKMQFAVVAPMDGQVAEVAVEVGHQCRVGTRVAMIDQIAATDAGAQAAGGVATLDESAARSVLVALEEHRELTTDHARSEAVTKHRPSGRLTARAIIGSLFELDTFVEIGGLAVASRAWRDPVDELARRTPADGVIVGYGDVAQPDTHAANRRFAVIAYDATVLAGTQGVIGTEKVERVIRQAERERLPVILLANGGGGRPGDLPAGVPHRPLAIFREFGRLARHVPLIGMATGNCFAGNAALLGCCHLIVATTDSVVGLGGPVVVEAAGLGRHEPSALGQAPLLHRLGIVDIVTDDDERAVEAVRSLASYASRSSAPSFEAPDQTRLRQLVPSNSRRAYDMRAVLDVIGDVGSVIEVGSGCGGTMLTAFARVDGQPIGIIANNPAVAGGAIDGSGAAKATKFLKSNESIGLPILFLCDTPGFAVGPEAEASGQLRDFGEFLTAGAQIDVPFGAVVTRKAFGLGAVAMCGGSARAPWFYVAWPHAEFGGMPPEASVRLSAARELEAIDDGHEREREFERRVDRAREHSAAINNARTFRVDDVIDPATTRRWIRMLTRVPREVSQ
jgi:acetyl-CoA carboxylase carboxyltransferase component